MANNKTSRDSDPCHRVIGANGSLVGYGGGLWMKQWLLNHEAAVAGHNDAGRHLGPDPTVRRYRHRPQCLRGHVPSSTSPGQSGLVFVMC